MDTCIQNQSTWLGLSDPRPVLNSAPLAALAGHICAVHTLKPLSLRFTRSQSLDRTYPPLTGALGATLYQTGICVTMPLLLSMWSDYVHNGLLAFNPKSSSGWHDFEHRNGQHSAEQ